MKQLMISLMVLAFINASGQDLWDTLVDYSGDTILIAVILDSTIIRPNSEINELSQGKGFEFVGLEFYECDTRLAVREAKPFWRKTEFAGDTLVVFVEFPEICCASYLLDVDATQKDTLNLLCEVAGEVCECYCHINWFTKSFVNRMCPRFICLMVKN